MLLQTVFFHTVPFRLWNACTKGQAPKVTFQSVFVIPAKFALMYGAGEVELTLIISQNLGAAAALSGTVIIQQLCYLLGLKCPYWHTETLYEIRKHEDKGDFFAARSRSKKGVGIASSRM